MKLQDFDFETDPFEAAIDRIVLRGMKDVERRRYHSTTVGNSAVKQNLVDLATNSSKYIGPKLGLKTAEPEPDQLNRLYRSLIAIVAKQKAKKNPDLVSSLGNLNLDDFHDQLEILTGREAEYCQIATAKYWAVKRAYGH